MSGAKLIGIYLNDHLAGSVAGNELVKRACRSNKGTELGRHLEGLAVEIEDDRKTLEKLMEDLGVCKDRAKQSAGWLAEKAGRLKLNGQILGYSPLSRLVELEGLCLGVEGKLSLWRALERMAASEERLAGIDLAGLIARAERQRAELEEFRLGAAAAVARAPS